MKKIQLFFALFILIFNVFSQEKYEKLPLAKTKNATYLFSKNIIGNEKIIPNIETSKEDIKELSILKDKPDINDNYYNLTEFGIVFVDLKYDLEVRTQSELNTFFGLDSENNIYIDGYLVDRKMYKVALKSIVELELVDPNAENGLKDPVLNIWTLQKGERH